MRLFQLPCLSICLGLSVAIPSAVTCLGLDAAAEEPAVTENVRQQDGAYTLDPGPNVEGVVLLRQGDWPPEVVETFHDARAA
jgi:hypothetical protein